MLLSSIIVFVVLICCNLVQSRERPYRTDPPFSISSDCQIDRSDLGRFDRVQISSHSISIEFQSLSCPSVEIHLSIVNTQTNQLERTLQNIQDQPIFIDQLLPDQNYSFTVQLSDRSNVRILPTHILQTLPSTDGKILTLAGNDLLTIEQIESFLLPHIHLYIVTIPSHLYRSTIFGKITLSYFHQGKQINYEEYVKPLDGNSISRLGRITRKTIAFSMEIPLVNQSSIDYFPSLQLFFLHDQHQSIVDRSGPFKSLSPLTVDFRPSTKIDNAGRSAQVSIEHLCPNYIEVKTIVYTDFLAKKISARHQCDMNKNHTTLYDITHGQCSIPLVNLQPEQNYTLSIRVTCPITSSFNPTSNYVFYDRTRLFTFQTSDGLPDLMPLKISFDDQKKILSWTTIHKNQSLSKSYLGPDYHYQLFSKSNENWTLIYHGNQSQYQIPEQISETIENATFQIFLANRYGRQENSSGEIQINLKAVQPLKSNSEWILFIVLISLLLLLLLFGILFLGYFIRKKTFYGKLKEKYYRNDPMSDKELEHLRSLNYSSGLKDNILYTWNHTPTNVDLNKLPKIERNLIKLDHLLGKGAFGEVYAGRLNDQQPVAIKTLLTSASENQRLDFLKEAMIMNQFDHEHIVHLVGVCFHHDHQAQFLVFELMDQGDLQNYLRHSRPKKDQEHCRLSYEDCLDIARQIADGASYLEQHSYVHRDLAARNCLVSSIDQSEGQIRVKIGDFGLARMLSQQDYYRKTGEALLPVRWMAPESLLDAIFTSYSDIWSFGIVLWEIITLGQVPYSPLNNQQVISLITTTRGRLEKPMQCTPTLYELMLLCWNSIPENRIRFSDIQSRLDQILSDSNKEQPSIWFTYDATSSTARTVLDSVLNHIEPPTSISLEDSETGECRSSTSGCFSSMTESLSPTHRMAPSYQLRLIDDTTSNDYADEDDHSDMIKPLPLQ